MDVKYKTITTLDWERVNANVAVWARDKDEVTDDEYNNFYKVSYGEHQYCTLFIVMPITVWYLPPQCTCVYVCCISYSTLLPITDRYLPPQCM